MVPGSCFSCSSHWVTRHGACLQCQVHTWFRHFVQSSTLYHLHIWPAGHNTYSPPGILLTELWYHISSPLLPHHWLIPGFFPGCFEVQLPNCAVGHHHHMTLSHVVSMSEKLLFLFKGLNPLPASADQSNYTKKWVHKKFSRGFNISSVSVITQLTLQQDTNLLMVRVTFNNNQFELMSWQWKLY